MASTEEVFGGVHLGALDDRVRQTALREQQVVMDGSREGGVCESNHRNQKLLPGTHLRGRHSLDNDAPRAGL